MPSTERIEAIARQCRPHHRPYPESLIAAICQYVAGGGTLASVLQEWAAAGAPLARFIALSNPEAPCLDEVDLRLLDICTVTNSVSTFLHAIAADGPIEQARAYLLTSGFPESAFLTALLDTGFFVKSIAALPNAAGRMLLSYLPDRFDEVLKYLTSPHPYYAHAHVFELLLAARPAPYLDLAWQVAQLVPPHHADAFAAALLKADPLRFTAWARQIAHATIQNHQASTWRTLEALLALDPVHHLDLALEAARAPGGSHQWNSVRLKCIGIEAAFRGDPENALSLVSEAAVAPERDVVKLAIRLLQEVDFEQARPILQACVINNAAGSQSEEALLALNVLLQHAWPERQAYMLSLLALHSRPIHRALQGWLVKEEEAIVEGLAPFLAEHHANARLTVVQVLQHVGGERARALLAARLDAEKVLNVKLAMLHAVVGLKDAAESAAAPTFSIEAITAEAGTIIPSPSKSPLPWFDLAQAPGLRWTTGEPVPQSVLFYLLSCQTRAPKGTLAERTAQALPWIDRSTSGDLAFALFTGWVRHGAQIKEVWCLPWLCALADERVIHPLSQSIHHWAETGRGVLADRAVEAMAWIESDLALAAIDHLAEHTSWVRTAANNTLAAAARHRNITLEELLDRIVPGMGFDGRGERVFDYGSRRFTIRLLSDQTFQITNNAGKRVARLPKPGIRDDAGKAQAALDAWILLKKQVPQAVKRQAQRLERVLDSRRSWSIPRWQELFLKHPLLRPLATGLVWGLAAPGGSGYAVLFRPLEDGSLTDDEGNAIQLPPEGQIRLVQPGELEEAARASWSQHLVDYEVAPPFSQLNRDGARPMP